MKGIVLAGGLGSRLLPLTSVCNKHILPVGKYPMIYHPLHSLKNGGITDVMIISGKEHLGSLVSQLGSGSNFGMNFTYRIQDKPDGIAGALKICEDYIRSSSSEYFTTILGDNIFENYLDFTGLNISEQFLYNSKEKINKGNLPVCKLFLKKVKDPNRFGVVKLKDEYGNKVVEIIEKPKKYINDLIVTGCYVYDQNIWSVLNCLKLSERNEYEITDVNNWYVENGAVVYKYLTKAWTDAGTHNSLIKANNQCRNITYKDFKI